MRVHSFLQPVIFGGVEMEVFWLAGTYYKRGIRNLITVKILYIDYYCFSKTNMAGRDSFERARRFMNK
ncbi:hypothetical protein EO93_18435 [Methanosarcina sp. 1.H.A.2.2]|nr:hypothetical protein EO93_18435 [Methanosarcina sp. 1.H.A.2.2]